MEEVRSWIHSWQRFRSDPNNTDLVQALTKPIESNDSVLNELLAKELFNNHLGLFCSLLFHHNAAIHTSTLSVLSHLAQSNSASCRRLAAMAVPYLLILEWIRPESDADAVLLTIFKRQELAIHPMPPTVRFSSAGSQREYALHQQYYELTEDKAGQWNAQTRLPITFRLTQMFIDGAGDAPKSVLLTFGLLWILLLTDGHSVNVGEAGKAEIRDIIEEEHQLTFFQGILEENRSEPYRFINEHLLLLLLEWIPFAQARIPAIAKALSNALHKRIREHGPYPTALLLLNVATA